MTDAPPALLRATAIGRAMIALGVLGIIVCLAGTVVGERWIGDIGSRVDESLALTGDALDAVVDSIEVTASIVATVQTGVRQLDGTMGTLQTTLGQARTALDRSSSFMRGPLPDALAGVNRVLPTIESIAGSVDTALRFLSRAPFGPDYHPSQPFDRAIGQLSTALSPLPAQLRALGTQLSGLTASSARMDAELAALRVDLRRLDTELTNASKLVTRYQTTAARAHDIAASSRTRLGTSARAGRWLLALIGLSLAAGQLVPIWLGLLLVSGRPWPTAPPPHDAT